MKKIMFFLRINRLATSIVIAPLAPLSLSFLINFFNSKNYQLFIACLTLFILSTILFTLINTGSTIYYDNVKKAKELLPVIFAELKLSKKTTRIAIHCRGKSNKERFIQLTPYYPTGEGQGREFSFTQGITGKAFRTMQASCYSIPKGKTLEKDLLKCWFFKESEIKQLKHDRKSYFAYPIGTHGEFANIVIFADSSDRNCFREGGEIYQNAVKKISGLFAPILSAIFSI